LKVLLEYYKQLKACDKYLSFVFVTGITKFIQGGLYSTFNNQSDISISPKYGALTGFTHSEIKQCYSQQLKNVAKSQKISLKILLEKMQNYYNGFCFDGQTFVYNPFSTLLFFEAENFDNFWFNTGTPDQLVSFFKENHFTLEEFRGIEVSRDRIKNPRQNRAADPAVYLYQLGYLSLRPGLSENSFTMDSRTERSGSRWRSTPVGLVFPISPSCWRCVPALEKSLVR
jgi:hypothetical protein